MIVTDMNVSHILQQVLKYSPQAVAIFDADMRYLAANDKWYASYDIVGQDIIGKSHYDVFPEITQDWKDIHQQCLQGAVISEEADPFRRSDGRTDYMKWTVRPWYQSDGEAIGGLLMFTEVVTSQIEILMTERKLESRYEALTKGNPAFVLFIDKDGDIEEVNHMAEETRNQVIGMPYEMVFKADPNATDVDELVTLVNDTLATGKVNKRIGRGTSQLDGSVAFYESRILPVHQGGVITGIAIIATDITAERRHQSNFETIVNAIPDLVFRFDIHGKYTYAKPSDQLLAPPEELVGKSVQAVIPGPLGDQLYQAIVDSIVTDQPISLEYTLNVPTGTLDYEARLFPIGETETLAVIRDMTALKQAQRQLEDTVRELNQSLLFKDQFLATMSHELRTPMNAILGYSTLAIASPNIDPKLNNMFERIKVNSDRLLKLINDVLDISRINAGRVEIVRDKFNLHTLLAGWEKDYRQLVTQKGLAFEFSSDPALPASVVGDAERMTQITNNLISNAIKFTDEGTVSLRVQRADDRAYMNIIVSDTGIGISEMWHHLIFEEFRQVDMGSTRKYDGAGLGLSIVQKLCLRMGGSISLSSKLGEGSTFIVTLPISQHIETSEAK